MVRRLPPLLGWLSSCSRSETSDGLGSSSPSSEQRRNSHGDAIFPTSMDGRGSVVVFDRSRVRERDREGEEGEEGGRPSFGF